MSTRLFASYVRRGAAAGITEADPGAGAYAGPATFQPSLLIARDSQAPATLAGPGLELIGPGAVVGLDPALILRTDPAPGATGVEDNYLVQIELARADLPWMFTPAAPSAGGRLRPWLVLVVVDAGRTTLEPGAPLPRITVADSELSDLDDSWGWAHVQVVADNPANLPPDPFTGDAACARLLCPRRLSPDTSYLACLVPATHVGAQAGLGLQLDGGSALAPAWVTGAGQDVVLPVYYSWTFATGAGGDFRSLVQRLTGRAANGVPGFGTRTIDLSAPWETPPPLGAGVTIALDGALTTNPDAGEGLGGDVQSAFEMRLTKLLDFPATQAPANAVSDPRLSVVAPPIYGGRHAGVGQVPLAGGWLRDLNLDPRRRIAAAFGVRYVQENKEFLMARAWDQLGAVQEANRLRARAELAMEVADRLHTRHVAPLGPSALISVAAPARTRAKSNAGATLQATVAATHMPSGAATPAFSRVVRPLGPVGRRAYAGTRATVIERGIASTIQVTPPPLQLDGIATLAATVGPSAAVQDATLLQAGTAFQRVVAVEQTIQAPADLIALRQALSTGGGGSGLTLGSGSPAMNPVGPTPGVDDAVAVARNVAAALLPSPNILKRLASVALVPAALGGVGTATRVMAGPLFPAPLALALIQRHQERLLPGLGNFPDDSVTLLQANGAFVEAFLAGANHEMNRELLWRDYPTDQRGTPFRWFWPRPDSSADVPAMTAWSLTTPLGQNGPAGGGPLEGMLVLLVRGEVLRRYPRTIVYAAPGSISAGTLTLDTSTPWTVPSFLLRLDATTTAFAYPLQQADVVSNLPQGVAGWYFVFSEPVAGPRFRFEEPLGQPFQQWSDLDWARVPQARGFAVAGAPLDPPAAPTEPAPLPAWNHDAADIARIAFARPFRVGFHADELLGNALS